MYFFELNIINGYLIFPRLCFVLYIIHFSLQFIGYFLVSSIFEKIDFLSLAEHDDVTILCLVMEDLSEILLVYYDIVIKC